MLHTIRNPAPKTKYWDTQNKAKARFDAVETSCADINTVESEDGKQSFVRCDEIG